MEKIFFLNFNCNWCPHFETDLELMEILKREGHEIFSLSCNYKMNTYCISNQTHSVKRCVKCVQLSKKGLDIVGVKNENRFQMKSFDFPIFPKFTSLDELKKYEIDGVNIGFGVLSSYMTITRDFQFNLKNHEEKIENYLRSAYLVYKNLDEILKNNKFDRIYIFNGRFAEYYPAIELAKKYKVDFYLHERGSSSSKYCVYKNVMLHDYNYNKAWIKKYWDSEKNTDFKINIGKTWFETTRSGRDGAWISFTKEQKTGMLPNDFDKTKENIAIFNSSLDERMAFDDWHNHIDANDNTILENIIKHFQNDTNKHFYLRIHPNLKNVKTTQLAEIKAIQDKNYPNLTVIEPDDVIDTYALIDNADKVLTFGSTVGIEATFWGKPSILAGKVLYEDLDCSHNAKNYEDLYRLIDAKLEAKPRENCYPYAFWFANYGKEFVHFKQNGLFKGKFKGKILRKKSLLEWLEVQFETRKRKALR